MKKIILAAFLIMVVPQVFAQTFMDAIVNKACDCMSQVPKDLTNVQELKMKLGLCVIEASLPYKKQLKKEMGIDLDKIEVEGEKLGRAVALKMVSVCPDGLVRMAQTVKNEGRDEAGVMTLSGTVTKVDNDPFVIFSIKHSDGKVSKFYWMTYVEAGDDFISDYAGLLGKEVSVTYRETEIFDPRIGEYRKFFVLTKIE